MMGLSVLIYFLFLVLNITNNKKTDAKDGLENQKKWLEDGKGRFKWSLGCSFPKGGFFAVEVDKIKKKESSTCPTHCYENIRCTHFIYTNGHCHLKMFKFVEASPKAAIYNNPGGMCGFVVDRPDVRKNWFVGDNGRTRWSTECDYPNAKFNMYSASNFVMFDKSKCSAYCLANKECTHYGWARGTCLLKDFRGVPVVQTVDKTISICGFIPERQNVAKQRTTFNTTVPPTRNSTTIKLIAKTHSTVTKLNDQRQKTESSSPKPKHG